MEKKTILALKLIVIAVAFAVIFSKADTDKIALYLKMVNPVYLLGAYLALTLAQVISAFRVKYYFKTQGLEFNNKFAVGLYFVGMFLNNILPGGIGGDGYKIFLLGKLADFPRLTSLRLLLSDRASGLFILMLLAFGIAYSCFAQAIPIAKLLLPAAAVITIITYFTGIKLLLKESPKTAVIASLYSFFVQILGIVVILAVLAGLGFHFANYNETAGYVLVFLVSSVLAVLPISIGGVGIRELSFLYGANLLGLDPERGVAIAIIYFVINLACSLNGLLFWHRLEPMYSN